jgi:hypothetical protein
VDILHLHLPAFAFSSALPPSGRGRGSDSVAPHLQLSPTQAAPTPNGGNDDALLTAIDRSRAFDKVRTDQRRTKRIVPIEDQPGGALLEAHDDGPLPSHAAETAAVEAALPGDAELAAEMLSMRETLGAMLMAEPPITASLTGIIVLGLQTRRTSEQLDVAMATVAKRERQLNTVLEADAELRVEMVLAILRRETELVMAQCGAPTIARITRGHVVER